jgi:AraC family transcriptional activator of tynA and feaB
LSQLEVIPTEDSAALVDLSAVEQGNRASVWVEAVPSLFPGLSVRRVDDAASIGDIRRIVMGGGSLWSVRSPSSCVSYTPSRQVETPGISLMMQRSGRTIVGQQRRMCALEAGDICVLDEQFPFTMEGEGGGEFIFLRMPRLAMLSRNPHLEHQTAIALLSVEPAVSLVGQTLSAVLRTAPFMRESQRRAAVVAMIELLGTIEARSEEGAGSAWWRVQAALSFIELYFAVHGLSAEDVAQAQRISRRRLDQLLRETIGLTITGQIWKRRLDQAAADLADPGRKHATASQIAFANGFEDAAHFTRAFRRSYGHSPLQWRQYCRAGAA